MGRKKKVLTLINEAAKDKKHKITVLPFMCGSGKSSAVSEKIAEAIKKREGLLVVTDRVKRLYEYLKPWHDKKLREYLSKNQKENVSILKSGSVGTVHESHHKHPVLMMTSQRFLRLGDKEIDFYLTWDNGRRNTILFDEKPELYFQYNISIETLNSVDLPLLSRIDASDMNQEEKKEYKNYWFEGIKWPLVQLLLCSEPSNPVENYYSLSGINSPEDNDFPPFISLDDCTDPEELRNREDYNDSIAMDRFSVEYENFTLKRDKKLDWKYRDTDLLSIIRALKLKDHFVQLYAYRSISTGKYESYYAVIQSEMEKMERTGSHVVILDGTADLSLDYKQKGIYVDKKGCERYLRELPELTLYLVECDTSKKNISGKNKKLLNMFIEYIKKDSRAKSVCCFSYKDLVKMDQNEKKETNPDEETHTGNTDENDEKSTTAYFGNVKGSNDFQNHDVYGQIGVNLCPETYYLSRYIDQQELRNDNKNVPDISQMIDSIIRSEEYQRAKYNDLVADIEQNIFRTPLRSPNQKKKVKYYVFYEFSKHSLLKQLLLERFTEHYKAHVDDSKNASSIMETSKTMIRRGKKTVAQVLLTESDKIPGGTVFRLADWLNKIDITRRQYYSAKQANKTVNDRFSSWLIDKHKGIYKKP